MGWFLKSKPKNVADGDTPLKGVLTTPRSLFRAVDFRAYPAGEGTQFVRVHDRAEVELLPAFVVDFLASCSRFIPLQEHAERYVSAHALGELEAQSLAMWLPRLREMNLFISAEQLRQECIDRGPAGGGREKMEMIGLPTGNSPDQLRRALESFAKNAQTHERTVRFVVASNASDDSQSRRVAREIEETFRTGVEFFGEAEKRVLAQKLVTASGCDPEALEFAFFDPENCGFLCGANRNVLLLEGAGELFSSVDDDMICRVSASPAGMTRGLKIFERKDIFERWFYPDRESALADADYLEADYPGLHETLLGRSVADCLRNHEDVTFDHLSGWFMSRLRRPDARVLMTCTGHVGDPGIPTSCYHLLARNESFRRLTQSEALYRAALGSRSVRALAPLPCVGDASLSPGMAIGLDARDLLPPFVPVLHAEDFVYGAALWQCTAGGFLGHVPYALNHEPALGKPILQPGDLNETNRATIFEFAHLLRHVLFEYRPALADESTGVRMMGLGRHLRGIAEAPFSEFTDYLRAVALRLESQKILYFENGLHQQREGADFWRRDVEAYLDHVRMAFGRDDFDIPYDLKKRGEPDDVRRLIQRLFVRYGRLLEAWPAIFEAAKGLSKTGKSSPR